MIYIQSLINRPQVSATKRLRNIKKTAKLLTTLTKQPFSKKILDIAAKFEETVFLTSHCQATYSKTIHMKHKHLQMKFGVDTQ